MASSNGKESAKMTASIDSLKLSSKNTSVCSSKHASSESVLSRKDKECLQMQECKKKLLAMEPQIIIRDENVVLRSPPQKKIVMPPTINAEVSVQYLNRAIRRDDCPRLARVPSTGPAVLVTGFRKWMFRKVMLVLVMVKFSMLSVYIFVGIAIDVIWYSMETRTQ